MVASRMQFDLIALFPVQNFLRCLKHLVMEVWTLSQGIQSIWPWHLAGPPISCWPLHARYASLQRHSRRFLHVYGKFLSPCLCSCCVFVLMAKWILITLLGLAMFSMKPRHTWLFFPWMLLEVSISVATAIIPYLKPNLPHQGAHRDQLSTLTSSFKALLGQRLNWN